MDKKRNWVIESAIIAVAIVVLGLSLKGGIDDFVNKDRKVTVKGLAEMEVPANKVTWPIVTKQTGNNMPALYASVNHTASTIKAYLKSNGISDKEISVNAPQVTDAWANAYGSDRPTDRYVVTSVITVTSTNAHKVRSIMARQGELLNQGIAIVDDYNNSVTYEYTSFQKIKPEMMDKAIENAQQTAEQFAKKSGSKLNKIESAGQGQFEITSRDQYTPYIKSLRVVTTVTYSLKD